MATLPTIDGRNGHAGRTRLYVHMEQHVKCQGRGAVVVDHVARRSHLFFLWGDLNRGLLSIKLNHLVVGTWSHGDKMPFESTLYRHGRSYVYN